MWILGRCCDEPRAALTLDIPPGAYFVPRSYDVHNLAALARLLCDAGQKVRDTVVMTWQQGDALEALGRVRGDGHRAGALWALHGDAGVPVPTGPTELKKLIAKRFPTMQPRWVLILDPDAPASSLGWLEAHVKMPLVSWFGRLLGDERHPLHAAAIDRIDVYALAAMTSDPLEMMEIVERAVEHRLTYAFPAGISVATVVSTPVVNVEVRDWARSLRVAAAQRLASRVSRLARELRADAVRVLLGLEVSSGGQTSAMAALVRAGLVVPASPGSDGRLALARSVLDDEDGRVVFQDAVELSGDERRAIDRDRPRRESRMLGPESPSVVARGQASGSAIAPEDVPGRYEALRQASEAKDVSATSLAELAEFLYRSKADPAQAAQTFERALAADPLNADVLRRYATFLSKEKGDLDRAQEMYERAITADPKSAPTLCGFANFLCHERRAIDRAQELYERAIAVDPRDSRPLRIFASFLWHERRAIDHAQELYERAIEADPKDAKALRGLANFMWKERRDLNRAQELYERAIEADPKDEHAVVSFAGFLSKERRDLDRAQRLYERTIEANPKDEHTLVNFADFLCEERRDLDRAQGLYERAIEVDPKDGYALVNFADFLYEERRDLDRAQQMFERAIEADPNNAYALGRFANFLHEERRDLDRAQQMYERAIDADPNDTDALGSFADFLWNDRSDIGCAQQMYERAVQADLKDANALGNLAHFLFLTGRRSAAIERLRQAIVHADTSPAALKSELAFYRAVHLPEERDDALRDLRALVGEGAQSPGWNFHAHAALAEKAGDADASLFFALADVLSGKADAATLAAFPRWTSATPV